ncbi:secreted protein, partial [Candidatus Magnetomorum sp. HK-1]
MHTFKVFTCVFILMLFSFTISAEQKSKTTPKKSNKSTSIKVIKVAWDIIPKSPYLFYVSKEKQGGYAYDI